MLFAAVSKIKFTFSVLFLLFFSGFTALAQQSGLDFLTIGPNSKALGLNEAITAELLGASNLYSNPANLALETGSSLDAAYSLWIGDLHYTNAGANFRNNNRAIALGFLGTQMDDIPLRNQPGPPEGSFTVSSFSLSGGYAFRTGPLAFGAMLQYLREEYYIYDASGYAASLGASALFWDDRLHIGTSLLNLGEMTELRNEPTSLPTTFRGGFDVELLTFVPPKNQDFPIVLNLKNDIVVPLQSSPGTTQENPTDEVYANIALEFNVVDTISLRTGYKTGNTVRSWSAGTGISVNSIAVDYAIIPFKTGYGTVHSVGLQYQF